MVCTAKKSETGIVGVTYTVEKKEGVHNSYLMISTVEEKNSIAHS